MNNIKKARLSRGFSQAELGKAVGLSPFFFNKRNPMDKALNALSMGLLHYNPCIHSTLQYQRFTVFFVSNVFRVV